MAFGAGRGAQDAAAVRIKGTRFYQALINLRLIPKTAAQIRGRAGDPFLDLLESPESHRAPLLVEGCEEGGCKMKGGEGRCWSLSERLEEILH